MKIKTSVDQNTIWFNVLKCIIITMGPAYNGHPWDQPSDRGELNDDFVSVN